MLKMRAVYEIKEKMFQLNQHFFSFKIMNMTDLAEMTNLFIHFQIVSHLFEA